MKIHTVELWPGAPELHEVVLHSEHIQALARVEAEHADDVKRYRQLLNEAGRDRYAAPKQLAEAVGLLKHVKDWFGWGDLPESLSKLDAFLARHAQAEQQEAQEIGPLKGAFAEAAEQAFREQYGLQEAQDAQAVDDARKAAFENHWYAQKATAFSSTEAQRHFDAGWKARADLAAQPAVPFDTERARRIVDQYDAASAAPDIALMNYGGCAIEMLREAVRGAEHE